MGWTDRFRRRRRGHRSVPLPSREPRASWLGRLQRAGLRLVSFTRQPNGARYLTLAGDDTEAAKRYLRAEPIEQEMYYVVVETPDGVWGTDVNGVYLEKLQPWQLGTDDAACRGRIAGYVDGNQSIAPAAKGFTDNWVAQVECGACGHTWIDGLRYRERTLVRCASCRATNVVDSSGSTYVELP